MLYILLTIIAIGVLLITREGKGILLFLGWLAIVSGILILGLGIIIGGVSLVFYNWAVITGFVGAVLALVILLFIWTLIFIVAPDFINRTLKTTNKKRTFWIVFFFCILLLFIYRLYMNYYYPSHIGF